MDGPVEFSECFLVAVYIRYPRFLGEGYIVLSPLRGPAFKEFSILIEFRPETSNGLLLFNADKFDARYDFFSVSLIDGKADFRLVIHFR